MNRPDFDEFAALWQDEPDRDELARMETLARKARRRGRLLGWADYANWIIIMLLFIGGIFMSPTPIVVAVATPLIAVMTWVTWKLRALRQMAFTLNTGDRRTFIQNSIRNVQANMRRGVLSLMILAFVGPFAILFKVAVRSGGGPREVLEAFGAWFYTTRALFVLTVVGLIAAYTLYQRRRQKAELRRLEGLQRRYEIEDDRDREEQDGG